MWRYWVSLLVSVAFIFLFTDIVQSSPGEDRLITELFTTRQYSPLSTPAIDINQTIHVELKLTFIKIVDVSEIEEVLRSAYWHYITWNDYRLTWNISAFDGVSKIYVPVSSIWTPEIVLYNNAKSDRVGSTSPQSNFVLIQSTGHCSWWPLHDGSVSHCPMSIRWFPFDDQFCPLILESWKLDRKQMEVHFPKKPVQLKFYQRSAEWELVDIQAVHNDKKYDCCESPFSRLVFTVHLRRKAMYYVINFVVPCFIFSALAVVTFLMSPTCGERIGLGITIMLALSVYQTIINDKLPTTSDEIPMLGIYFVSVMVMCGVSVGVTMLGMYLHNYRLATNSPMSPFVKLIFCDIMGTVLCVTAKSASTMSDSVDVTNEKTDKYVAVQNDSNALDSPNHLTSVNTQVETIVVDIETGNREAADKTSIGENNWLKVCLVVDRLGCCIVCFGLILAPGIMFLLAANGRNMPNSNS